jgi:F-type H+-transporting ATPase subunit b
MKEPYKEWAQGHIDRVKSILNSARADHTNAVKERIANVEKMKDVVSVTEGLFGLAKETAQLESEVFVQRQKVQLAAEVKSVLDSWVRFEQQQKESEQAELAKAVIDNVLKSIRDEKTQRDILAGAVAEVERMLNSFLHISNNGLMTRAQSW